MSKLEWSDDEENDIVPQPDRMFPPSDSESEYEYDYSEINKLILDTTYENKYNFQEKIEIKKVKKSKSEKNKVTFDWNDLNKQKETKWMSKRMKDRKIQEGNIKKVRQFNPRLPIPLKKYKNKNKDKDKNVKEKLNMKDFPEL